MNTLIVFVRYPEPGRVKTRIARELGAQKAAEIYRLMAEKVVENVSESDEYDTLIFFDPIERMNGVRQWLGRADIRYEPQTGTTVGERMREAFESVFSRGAEKAVLIGTDVPDITREIVTEAFRFLEQQEAVIGPAEDGGYYLLGLKKPEPFLFDDIEWGSGSVCERTIRHFERLGLSYTTLDVLKDVDTAEDVTPRLLQSLACKQKKTNMK